jgi:hypothetical protein
MVGLLALWIRKWSRWEGCCVGKSYVVEIAITEQSSTTGNHGPELFPSALLKLRDAASMFDVVFGRVIIAFGPLLDGRRHGERYLHQGIWARRLVYRNID